MSTIKLPEIQKLGKRKFIKIGKRRIFLETILKRINKKRKERKLKLLKQITKTNLKTVLGELLAKEKKPKKGKKKKGKKGKVKEPVTPISLFKESLKKAKIKVKKRRGRAGVASKPKSVTERKFEAEQEALRELKTKELKKEREGLEEKVKTEESKARLTQLREANITLWISKRSRNFSKPRLLERASLLSIPPGTKPVLMRELLEAGDHLLTADFNRFNRRRGQVPPTPAQPAPAPAGQPGQQPSSSSSSSSGSFGFRRMFQTPDPSAPSSNETDISQGNFVSGSDRSGSPDIDMGNEQDLSQGDFVSGDSTSSQNLSPDIDMADDAFDNLDEVNDKKAIIASIKNINSIIRDLDTQKNKLSDDADNDDRKHEINRQRHTFHNRKVALINEYLSKYGRPSAPEFGMTEEELNQHGFGEVLQEGEGPPPDILNTSNINEIMERYPSWQGAISRDRIKQMANSNSLPKTVTFILNHDVASGEGTHWIAVHINDKSLSYFDPLANSLPADIKSDLLLLDKKMKTPHHRKLKVNRVEQQKKGSGSETCGWHSMQFLMKMLRNGGDFKKSSNYKGENDVDRLQKKFDFLF